MDNTAKAARLAEIGKLLAYHTRKITSLHAEQCSLLCSGYTDNAAALGLDPAVDPSTIAPKD